MPRRLGATVSEALMDGCASVVGFTAAANFRFASDEPLVAVEALAGSDFVTAGAGGFSSFAMLSGRAAFDAPLASVAFPSAAFAAAPLVSPPRARSGGGAGGWGAGGVATDGGGSAGVVIAAGGGVAG